MIRPELNSFITKYQGNINVTHFRSLKNKFLRNQYVNCGSFELIKRLPTNQSCQKDNIARWGQPYVNSNNK